MASRHEANAELIRETPKVADSSPRRAVWFFVHPWLLIGVGWLTLHLSHPLVWRHPQPSWWFPPAGIGLVLVAWLGWRGVVLVGVDCLLVYLQAYLTGTPTEWSSGWPAVGAALVEAVLTAGEAAIAWCVYYHLGRCSRHLNDPRSAMLFLLLVPIFITGDFAVAHALPSWLAHPGETLTHRFTRIWLSHALGVLTLGPLLLNVLTPWLVRRGWVLSGTMRVRDVDIPARLQQGDILEILVLAISAGFSGLVPALTQVHREMAGWQLWGIPLLIIVWASLRQGLRGGTVVAAVAAIFPLLGLSFSIFGSTPNPFVQGNLLAQCSTALLVATSAHWIRLSEGRYRQVVGHLPVVLYSARVTYSGKNGSPPRAELTFVSPASRTLVGCPPEDLLGDYNCWLEHVHPSDRELVMAALVQLSRQNQPVICEYRLAPAVKAESSVVVLLPGSPLRDLPLRLPAQKPRERWIRDTLAPHFGPDGQLEGWEGILTDITEQRGLANDLRRTTSMFHALVANLPAGVFFVQRSTGRPILVNARARQLLGQQEDPSVNVSDLVRVYRLRRPDGTPYPLEELPVISALYRGTTSMRDDIVVHRPDGRRIPLVTWAAPVMLGSLGTPDAAVWVFEDLTALHQAEAARRESEARLRTVIETMAEGLMVQDEQGRIVQCNPAACSILGLSHDRLRHRSFADPDWRYLREDNTPFPKEDLPSMVSLRTGQPVRNVVMGIPVPVSESSQRECIRWILVNSMPMNWGRQSASPQVVTTFSDITAHRHALEVLRVSEEKYRGLVETLPVLVLQCDRDLHVTYMNPAAQTITGYELADVREPGSWRSLIDAEDLPKALDLLPQVWKGHTVRLEMRYRAKDESERFSYSILQPRWQANGVVGLTHLIVDLTRERQLEHELQRAQRLEIVGKLSSGIAHDFNNLLTVVLTLTDLARGTLPDNHPTQADLRHITDAAGQAANLANQLLTLSKQRRQALRQIELNQLARRTLELLHASLPSNISVRLALHESDLLVRADETQLQQVLMNLCLNARDAMPKGGCLTVSTSLATDEHDLGATVPNNGHNSNGQNNCSATNGAPHASSSSWVQLSVQDSGQGMSENVRLRIFDPFFSTKENGTGLGLSMAQHIVQTYGGKIDVWTQPGEGARFDVWLPLDGMTNEILTGS